MNDIRFVLRQLGKGPAFAVTAIATVAICLGANLAIFAVINSILLRPLPFLQPDRLVSIYEHDTVGNHPDWSAYLPVDGGSMKDWQQAAQGLAEMAFLSPW